MAGKRKTSARIAAGQTVTPKKRVTSKAIITKVVNPRNKCKTTPRKSAIKASTSGPVGQGRVVKRKRRQSIATKVLKAKKAAKGRKTKINSGKEDKEDEAPEPVNAYNDELMTTSLEWEIDSIVDSREVKGNIEYCIKWKGWDSSHNSWEPEVHLRNATDAISEFDDANPHKP